MDVKVITVFNNSKTFENEVKKYLDLGYKVSSSTMMPNTMGSKASLNIVDQKVVFYALMIKE